MEAEDEVRAPIAPKMMKLIDDDYAGGLDAGIGAIDNYNSDSDEEADDMERAINRSLRDVYGGNYDEKRKIRKNEKYEDQIINTRKTGDEYKKEILASLDSLLQGDEYKELYSKVSCDIILYTNGLETSIDLDSASYYEVSDLISTYLPDCSKTLFNIIKPLNVAEYIQYKRIADASKKDTVNVDAVEINERKKIMEPILKKIKILVPFDIETRELENDIKDDIDKFMKNKTEFILLSEDNYNKFVAIINSIKNKTSRDSIFNITKIKT